MVNDSEKSQDAFRTISEVAEALALPQHVLRFWETRFSQIKPLKRGGGRRYYRPEDIELVRAIQHLLYQEGYTIKGVQRILKEKGLRAVIAASGTMRQEGRHKMFAGEMALTPHDDEDAEALHQGGGSDAINIEHLEALLREIDACASLLESARLDGGEAGLL